MQLPSFTKPNFIPFSTTDTPSCELEVIGISDCYIMENISTALKS
jgi:hypothetical protein